MGRKTDELQYLGPRLGVRPAPMLIQCFFNSRPCRDRPGRQELHFCPVQLPASSARLMGSTFMLPTQKRASEAEQPYVLFAFGFVFALPLFTAGRTFHRVTFQ